MKKYFHELTKLEVDSIIKDGIHWEKLEKDYPQPVWCNFPNVLIGGGCWSLMMFRDDGSNCISGKDDCKDCKYLGITR